MEFLIKNGANVNHEDKKQQTPMIIAKRSNKQAIMNCLLEHGARQLEDHRKFTKMNEKIKKAQELTQSKAPLEKSNGLPGQSNG